MWKNIGSVIAVLVLGLIAVSCFSAADQRRKDEISDIADKSAEAAIADSSRINDLVSRVETLEEKLGE